jgi:hypothetical protein
MTTSRSKDSDGKVPAVDNHLPMSDRFSSYQGRGISETAQSRHPRYSFTRQKIIYRFA